VKAPDEQVHADIDGLLRSPSQLADRPVTTGKAPRIEQAAEISSDTAKMFEPQQIEKDFASNDQTAALISDLDRLRMNKDRQIPMDIDKDGNPIYRSLDSMVEEVKANQEAATHLESCINPPAQEAA